MKKKLLIIMWAIMTLLLSACAVAQVSYSLGDDFTVTVDYKAELHPGDEDAVQYTNAITRYWDEMGFSTAFDETDGVFTLTGTKRTAYESPEEAFNAFSALLKDDNSIFQDVQITYAPSFEYDHYSLNASVSLQDIIRQSVVQNIPEGEIDTLEGSAANGAYTLCVSLPGEVVSTNADAQQDGLCTWTLPYGEVTRIFVETQKKNSENLDRYAALQQQKREDEKMLLIVIGALALIIGALIAVTIVRKRKNRPLKVRIKKF